MEAYPSSGGGMTKRMQGNPLGEPFHRSEHAETGQCCIFRCVPVQQETRSCGNIHFEDTERMICRLPIGHITPHTSDGKWFWHSAPAAPRTVKVEVTSQVAIDLRALHKFHDCNCLLEYGGIWTYATDCWIGNALRELEGK
jgi:hypothetical protein